MTNHSFDNQMSPETYLCHGPFDPEVFGGVVNPPVYHASTVIFKNCKELNEQLFGRQWEEYCNNTPRWFSPASLYAVIKGRAK
ncbi:hypothetical protein [Klebsiella pneumoniae]|uniref:hypothetical protein n=1 Tax=Klebsiella pneumoniae TaxID=573 RepID=UPI000E2B5CD1|nr:hypothetical protein [Klebsiella pneumoniae]SXB79869.1 cystathionine beta-lyase [Klebsiella pneumoniae]